MKTYIKKYKLLFLFVTLIATLSSCEKEIDVDLNSVPPRMQIEGIVKQGELATVRVSHTIDFNDNSGYPNLEGAIVTISDNAGNSEILKQDETGWYTAEKLIGVEGRTYKMSVVYEGEEYTATSQMPPKVSLDSLYMTKVLVMDYAFPTFRFKDPAGTVNQYYLALLYINGKQHPDVLDLPISAEFMDGSTFDETYQVYSNDSDNDPIKKGDEITIEFRCIDKGVYTFFDTLYRMDNFLTNPVSNISNGALGYFSACTTDRKSIIADWKD